MKVLSSLLWVTAAVSDSDSHALLQSKKDHQSRDIVPLLDRATSELLRLSGPTVSDTMDQFSKQLKKTSTSLLQMPQTEQDALLQRASQGKEFGSFVQAYKALPMDVQKLVNDAALHSPAMNNVYDSLQPADKNALLQKLDQSATGKRCETVTRNGERVRQCTTFTRNGEGGHTHVHWHGDKGSGTETTTRNKNGELVHRHTHSHTHNGQGGNARTETTTQGKNDYAHGHSTSHTLRDGRTSTGTATNSVTHGGGNSHSHTHGHTHKTGENTVTNTATVSRQDGEVIHSHEHGHRHSERTGSSYSVTDTNHGPRIDTGNIDD